MTTTNRMTTLADLTIGNPKTVLNLTAVPLSGNPASTLDYLLIAEALEAKKVIVEEVSEGGSVPELRMTNFASKVVLIVDGTELVGAKQNRIVNGIFQGIELFDREATFGKALHYGPDLIHFSAFGK